MLRRDLILSVVLHVLVFAVALFASPLDRRRTPEYMDVIRVGVVSLSEIQPASPEPVPEVATPQALQAEPEEIVLENPTTRPAAEIEEPIEQPELKPPDQPKPKRPPSAKTTEAGDRDQAGTEDGQVEVEAPAGSGISGVRVDNASFNYPFWFSLAFNKLSQNFRIPVVIDGSVHCDIYFQVIKSGRVIESSVTSSSGIPQFDQACLAAIERSAPFPPLPREFLDEIIGLNITFSN